jgi:hypothetical protein
MNQQTSEHQKLLQHIDQQRAQATDEETRQELQRLRERLNTPEMRAMVRDLAGSRPSDPASLVLEFHDPLLPNVITATACVIAAATCLFAIVEGFKNVIASVAGQNINLWLLAVLAGGVTALFTAISFLRTFSVRVDTEGMTSRVAGSRWKQLQVGAMPWKDIRSLKEREGRILEVHAAGGKVLEIPMRVVNFPILQQHLENMVRLYGDRPAS